MFRFKLRTLLILLILLAAGTSIGTALIFRRPINALYYDSCTFYARDGGDRFEQCLLSPKVFRRVFVSIDNAPGKRLSELAWDDFNSPGGELDLYGNAEKGTVVCGVARFSFVNGAIEFVELRPADRLSYSGSADGPFIKLAATRKQIETAFGKPKQVGFADVHAP